MTKKGRVVKAKPNAIVESSGDAWDNPLWNLKSFNNLFSIPRGYADLLSGNIPEVDMIDEGKSIRVKVDLPGARKEDIDLTVVKDRIIVKATTKKAREQNGKGYYYSERSSSDYYRSIPLPSLVDEKSAEAKFEDGTLEVTVRKVDSKGSKVNVG